MFIYNILNLTHEFSVFLDAMLHLFFFSEKNIHKGINEMRKDKWVRVTGNQPYTT